MAQKLTKEYIQFSKRLVTYTMIIYGIVRIFSIVAIFFNVECGQSMPDIVRGIDSIAIVCLSSYCINSVSEKAITGYFGKNKCEKEDDDNVG